MDVVIPTYRCDLSMLRALTSLGSSDAVSLNTIVVVDRPDAPTLQEIQALQSYAVARWCALVLMCTFLFVSNIHASENRAYCHMHINTHSVRQEVMYELASISLL